MIKRSLFAAAVVWCAAASAVMAEEAGVQLKEVVVTATKTEKEPQDVTQSVTVITADEIKKSGAVTAAEVIERTAGVEVNDYGPTGSLTNIGIRGSAYQQVLVLLDGRRLNSASAGGFNMSDLPVPVDVIDRIEIVRGPSSALYGADAVGGVVNIITKKPSNAATTVTGSAGSHGFENAALSNSNKLGKFYYTVSGGREKYDGFRENSDLNQWTAGIKMGYDFSTESSLEISADSIGKEIGVPGSTQYPSPLARQWDRNAGSSLTYKTKFSKEVDLRLNAYQTRDVIHYLDPMLFTNSKHTSTSTGADAQINLLASSWNQLTFGVEAKQDHVDSTSVGEHTASLWAAYLQDEISLGDSLIVVIGGRNDSHSVFGDKLSPKVSGRYLFAGTGTIIRASAGEAFRAPTLNDLFWPFDGFEHGNPDLKPETSKEYEAGIEQPFGKGHAVKVTFYDRKVDNLIQWQPDALFIYSPVNIGKAHIRGAESESKFVPFERFTWAVNYTYMDAKDDLTGGYLLNVPKNQLKSYLNLALSTGTNIYLEGRTVMYYAQPGESGRQYTVADGKITQSISFSGSARGDVFVGVKNIFDRHYQTVPGYPMPPEEVYGGVSFRF